MHKIEEIRANGTQGRLAIHGSLPTRSNLVSISAARVLTMPPAPLVSGRGFALGRKGRRARVRRRMTDGFFLAAALGTAALLCWSAL